MLWMYTFAVLFEKRLKWQHIEVIISESSSAGRARPCQGRGRGFESRLSLKTEQIGLISLLIFVLHH